MLDFVTAIAPNHEREWRIRKRRCDRKWGMVKRWRKRKEMQGEDS
jgi:hypothetical protein